MGVLNIQDPSGHIAFDWTDKTIGIDLRPANVKEATHKEREYIAAFLKYCIRKGNTVKIDGSKCSDESKVSLKSAATALVSYKNESKSVVTDELKKLLGTDIFANHLLFRISGAGKGELIQKTDFTLDEKKYQSCPIPVGG